MPKVQSATDEGERAGPEPTAARTDVVMGLAADVQPHLEKLVTMRLLGAGDAALVANGKTEPLAFAGHRVGGY